MKNWHEVYESRINNGYYDYFCTKYKCFLDKLENSVKEAYGSKDESTILELGCGTANSTKYLIERFGNKFKYVAVDSCSEMIELAKNNIKESRVGVSDVDCTFYTDDIFEFIKRGDNFDDVLIAHSHGVLEHFDDDGIFKIISFFSQSQCHYVPSIMYETPSRGDERLMSVEHWKNIVKSLANVESFNSGFDLLVW